MSITVNNKTRSDFNLSVNEIKDGRAYETQDGELWIGNKYDDVRAFSVIGHSLVFDSSYDKFREVNITITRD